MYESSIFSSEFLFYYKKLDKTKQTHLKKKKKRFLGQGYYCNDKKLAFDNGPIRKIMTTSQSSINYLLAKSNPLSLSQNP